MNGVGHLFDRGSHLFHGSGLVLGNIAENTAAVGHHLGAFGELVGAIDDLFDQRLCLGALSLRFPFQQHPLRHVGRILDDLVRLPVEIKNRIVRPLNPNFTPRLSDPLEFRLHIIATVQTRPELAVLNAVDLFRADKHAVMSALDLLQRVSHRVQKDRVCGHDGSVHLKLHDRL